VHPKVTLLLARSTKQVVFCKLRLLIIARIKAISRSKTHNKSIMKKNRTKNNLMNKNRINSKMMFPKSSKLTMNSNIKKRLKLTMNNNENVIIESRC